MVSSLGWGEGQETLERGSGCGQILECGMLCLGVVPPYSPLSLESMARNES